MSYNIKDCTNQTVDQVLTALNNRLGEGLSNEEVVKRQQIYGLNDLPTEEKSSIWELIREQFNDNLVRILLLAALVSAFLSYLEHSHSLLESIIEPFVIILVLVVNAFISALQSKNAEDAIEALKEYEPEIAKVFRSEDKQFKNIKASLLVPGDIVQVSVGNRVPADIRICAINSTTLRVDQSILTGESVSVIKCTEPMNIKNPVNQDKKNILFSGTNISSGNAIGVVIATGLNTEIGKIRNDMVTTETQRTPLQNRLDHFGSQLSKMISVICLLVWIINIGHFNDPIHGGSVLKGAIYYFKIAVALAVAAIPEGLPAVITTCLALGTRRMAKKNAIVRSLPSVETLGCTSVICSDKTGTLTTNQMCVTQFFTLSDNKTSLNEFTVDGLTYEPFGAITMNDSKLPKDYNNHPLLIDISKICSLCNDSNICFNENKKQFEKIGEATEAALICLVEKINFYNIDKSALIGNKLCNAVNHRIKEEYEKKTTLEFSRDRKSMSVYCIEKASNKKVMFVKGAPECLIDRCTSVSIGTKNIPLTDKLKQLIMSKCEFLSEKEVLRCLLLAKCENPVDLSQMDLTDAKNFVKYETNLVFVGIVGMKDPPRSEVKPAILACKEAGIRTIMITGDNKNTAVSIAKQIGLITLDDIIDDVAYSGVEFDALSNANKMIAVKNAKVFARVEPSQKFVIVDFLQKSGEITAMTGDGVNDAPALKKAEIGIAMGSGTSVAKSASDMVLADDNFASIVSAVEEGRAIFLNTQQFIRYLISSNIGEVISIFVTSMLGLPEGLIPVQLLWVNLITDGLPATALGFSPTDSDIMKRAPRNPKEALISGKQMIRFLVTGAYVGFATVIANTFWYMYDMNGPHLSLYQLMNHQQCSSTNPLFTNVDCSVFNNPVPMTMALSVLVVSEMFNSFNSVSELQSIFVMPPWKNMFLILAVFVSLLIHFATITLPFTQTIFSVTSLNYDQWKYVILISFPVILIDELFKLFGRLQLSQENRQNKKND